LPAASAEQAWRLRGEGLQQERIMAMRTGVAMRFWLVVALGAALALGTACSDENPDDQKGGPGVLDGGGGGDSSIVDDTEPGEDTTEPADGPDGGGGTTDGAGTPETADTSSTDAATPDEVGPDGTVEPVDAGATDAAEDVPVKKLPLPDCAKDCFSCTTACKEQPVCGPHWEKAGEIYEYFNDCDAICKNKAFDGLGAGFFPKACPACKACKIDEVADPKGFCVTLANNAQLTIDMACKAECMEKSTKVSPNPTKGACKSKCSYPVAQGGAGCLLNVFQPVCAKEDAKTYATECAMQACDMQGCYPVGAAAKSTACDPGKMTKACDGECFDATKSPGCTDVCKPVCGILTGKGAQTYRNECVAKGAGAKVGNCDGITATPKDKCSAQIYVDKGLPCCKEVDYNVVKQVCASKGSEADAPWYTFRSKGEFDCLTAAEKDKWVFQYYGACVCNCPLTGNPVCGDNKITYANACQAKCYNGDTFTWKDGACE
jgi:hypothetical protein